jgi:hypothetical protein
MGKLGAVQTGVEVAEVCLAFQAQWQDMVVCAEQTAAMGEHQKTNWTMWAKVAP